LKLKDQYDAQDQITKMIEEDPDSIATMLQDVLNGNEEIPQELMDSIQGKKKEPPKEESPKKEDAPKKKEAPKKDPPNEDTKSVTEEVSTALEGMIEKIVDKKLQEKKGNLMRNKMASRVAYRYMKQAGLLSKIVDFFSEPPREKAKKPVFDVAKVWVTGGLYGTTMGWVSKTLKLKGKDTAVIDYRGTKLKLSINQERVKGMKDDGGLKGNIFIVVSLTGVDENIPKRQLDKLLEGILREARLEPDFTNTPVEHPNMR
jgi:hypothetical protein